MNLSRHITKRLSYFLLLLSVTPQGLFSVPVLAQSSYDSGKDIDTTNEQSDGDGIVQNPIEAPKGERTLEQEFDEHNVDWHSWAEKVAHAVWDPLIESGALVCGHTRVIWQVTSDCRVRIISVQTPLAGGADPLVASIKALNGNAILAFPPDSKKTVVDREARVGGRAFLHRVHPPIVVYP